jgi:hypothetical protein
MPLALLFALQAAAAPASSPLIALDFDLAHYQPPLDLADPGCNRADRDAIVVCGHRGNEYPLARMARIYEPGRLVAATRLGHGLIGDVSVHNAGEHSVMPPDRGVLPNRVMVGLHLPF